MTRVISCDIISAISSPMFDFSMSKNDSFSRLYRIFVLFGDEIGTPSSITEIL